jgi:hypothetical protein
MQSSTYLARLIGPVMLVAALGMLLNAAAFRAMAQDFLRSPPLVFLSGVLTMTAGMAIVLYHNVWTADWRLIITLLGWAGAVGGAARMTLPAGVKSIGEAVLGSKPWIMTTGGVFWLAISAVLCIYGYFA